MPMRRPGHEATLDALYIGKHEVTSALCRTFIRATRRPEIGLGLALQTSNDASSPWSA